MLMKIWTTTLLFLAWLSFCAWLVLVCHEKNIHPLRDFCAFFKKQSKVGRVLLGTFFIALWVIASTKPGGGSGGGDGGGISPERSEHCEAMSLEGCSSRTVRNKSPLECPLGRLWKCEIVKVLPVANVANSQLVLGIGYCQQFHIGKNCAPPDNCANAHPSSDRLRGSLRSGDTTRGVLARL